MKINFAQLQASEVTLTERQVLLVEVGWENISEVAGPIDLVLQLLRSSSASPNAMVKFHLADMAPGEQISSVLTFDFGEYTDYYASQGENIIGDWHVDAILGVAYEWADIYDRVTMMNALHIVAG